MAYQYTYDVSKCKLMNKYIEKYGINNIPFDRLKNIAGYYLKHASVHELFAFIELIVVNGDSKLQHFLDKHVILDWRFPLSKFLKEVCGKPQFKYIVRKRFCSYMLLTDDITRKYVYLKDWMLATTRRNLRNHWYVLLQFERFTKPEDFDFIVKIAYKMPQSSYYRQLLNMRNRLSKEQLEILESRRLIDTINDEK